jgi:septal ring factor EnvC (AmiA/AmiB activator)
MKQLVMKIKKYWTRLTTAVLGLFGLVWLVSKIFTKKKLEKTETEIKKNENEISKSEGKSEVVNTKRKAVKKEIADIKNQIKKTETVKKRKPGRPKKTTTDAKQNIVSKTKTNKK